MRATIRRSRNCSRRPEWAAQVALPLMGVGRIRIHNVRALIPQRDCGVSLLGQSALEKFSIIVQQGGVITFRR